VTVINTKTSNKNVTTYGRKNRQFRRINKYFNEQRDEGFGDPQFFKTVQIRADIASGIRGKKQGKSLLSILVSMILSRLLAG
jgi:hypothetical protein